MNLSPIQIAARNLYADLYEESDASMIELAFLDPRLSDYMEQLAAASFAGPFGSLQLDEPCGCAHLDGYVQALTETVEHIAKMPPTPSLTRLVDDIAARVADVTQVEPDKDDITSGTEALAGLFTALFGRPVQVVRVESTSR